MTRNDFESLYATCLAEAIEAHPEEYGYPATHAPTVARKMIAALDRGDANLTHSDGFKRLAKRLGVTYTAANITKAWKECAR